MERGLNWLWMNLAQWGVFSLVGFVMGWAMTGRLLGGLQLSLSLLVWGVFVRTVLVWHITWSVNSVTHRWGYRNYETNEGSRNNFLIGLLSNGEGWHNNHHAQPRAASHGHYWWELDVTYLTLRLLAICGLAWDIVLPEPKLREQDGSTSNRLHSSSRHRPLSRGLRPNRQPKSKESKNEGPKA